MKIEPPFDCRRNIIGMAEGREMSPELYAFRILLGLVIGLMVFLIAPTQTLFAVERVADRNTIARGIDKEA
jgi:hypothetical protein